MLGSFENKDLLKPEPNLDRFKYQYEVSYKDDQACADTIIYSNHKVDKLEAKEILIDQLNASNIESTGLIITKLIQVR